MILSTGIGSLLSERAHLDTPGRLLVWATLLVFFVLLLSLWFPVLVRASEGMGLSVRALVAPAAIVPAGAMMGFGFPTGMRLVNAIDRRPTALVLGGERRLWRAGGKRRRWHQHRVLDQR